MNKKTKRGHISKTNALAHNILKTGVTQIGRNLENKEIW
jgi:hypothetical protein